MRKLNQKHLEVVEKDVHQEAMTPGFLPDQVQREAGSDVQVVAGQLRGAALSVRPQWTVDYN